MENSPEEEIPNISGEDIISQPPSVSSQKNIKFIIPKGLNVEDNTFIRKKSVTFNRPSTKPQSPPSIVITPTNETSVPIIDIQEESPTSKYYQMDDDETPRGTFTSSSEIKSRRNSVKSSRRKSVKQQPPKLKHAMMTWFRTQRESLKQKSKSATPEAMLTTGPIVKMFKYGKIPWKLLIQCLLVVLITVKIFLLSDKRNNYFINNDITFATSFLKEGFENYEANVDGYFSSYFYSTDDVITDISNTVSSYYLFPRKNVDVWVFPRDLSRGDLISPVEAKLSLFTESPREFILNGSDTTFSREPIIEESDLLTLEKPLGSVLEGYFANNSRSLFDRLDQLTLKFSIIGLDRSHYVVNGFAECVFWTITKTYKNNEGGKLTSFIVRDYDICNRTDRKVFMEFYKPAIWISLIISIASTIALALDIKSVIFRLRMFKKIRDLETIKHIGQVIPISSDDNFIKQKIKRVIYHRYRNICLADLPGVLSYWFIFSFSQHTTNMFSFLFELVAPGNFQVNSFFIGMSCMLTYSSTMRFFQFNTDFYMFSKAFERGLPQVIRFIITTLPLYIGFGVLGTVMFGEYSRYFLDLNESLVTLFSLIFQDNMHDTFDSVFGNKTFTAYFSRLYIYVYTAIFICVIANVFTSIMEDAFFSLKENQENLNNQVQEEEKKNNITSTSVINNDDDSDYDTESNVSVMDVSLGDITDEEEIYWNQAIEKEQKKETNLVETKNKYFPNESKGLSYILDEESVEENIYRILHIVREASNGKVLTEEQQALMEEIERNAKSVYSKGTSTFVELEVINKEE